MRSVIHVHQQKIKAGKPAIIIRTYRRSTHHTLVTVCCPHCGKEAGTFVQTPEPDSCGARVTFVTTGTTRTVGEGFPVSDSTD